MKLAAIDIGSNAVRLQITNTIEWEDKITFKKLEYIRFPLRLGQDVFNTGRISDFNEDRFMSLMNAYKLMIDLYHVDHFYGCATSAMRESVNGQQILNQVKEKWDLDIELIDGKEEARLINEAVKLNMETKDYLHVDVGGGSTELNFYSKGKQITSGSFLIGSVRRLHNRESPEVWDEMKAWISSEIKTENRLYAVGTGGNLNKLFELSETNPKESRSVSIQILQKTVDRLKELTLDERMLKLQLNSDRADVILPASEIYLGVMEMAGVKKILVPDVGLKDGINLMLYERANPNHNKIWVRN